LDWGADAALVPRLAATLTAALVEGLPAVAALVVVEPLVEVPLVQGIEPVPPMETPEAPMEEEAAACDGGSEALATAEGGATGGGTP